MAPSPVRLPSPPWTSAWRAQGRFCRRAAAREARTWAASAPALQDRAPSMRGWFRPGETPLLLVRELGVGGLVTKLVRVGKAEPQRVIP